MAAAARPLRSVGSTRLLEHCEALGRATERESLSARVRVESALGPELAARLLGALATGRQPRARISL